MFSLGERYNIGEGERRVGAPLGESMAEWMKGEGEGERSKKIIVQGEACNSGMHRTLDYGGEEEEETIGER